MALRKRFGFFILGGLLASALFSGCGGDSSSETTTVPSTATVFYAHSVAFKNSSSTTSQPLYSWGYNAFGQLGNGTLSTTNEAAPVPGLGAVDGFAAGGDHTLAFKNLSSSVWAWGANNNGQVGLTVTHTQIPTKIALDGPVTDVAAGGFHSLAVAGGQVRSWGYNGFGQLGDDSFVNKSTPVAVLDTVGTTPINGIAGVAAGGTHSLARTDDGRVYAWGNNASGQLGKDPASPVPTVSNAFSRSADLVQLNSATLDGVVRIAAGGSTSYALRNTGPAGAVGQVWFWGYNPVTRGINFIPTPIDIPVAANITKISAGLDHLLMLADNGTVWAWGFNGFSQLGDTTTSNSATPVQVRTSTTATDIMGSVIDIIAFGNHSMARRSTDGLWYGWGDNSSGQLGNPIATNSVGYISVPVRINGL
ncbi:MAG: hypothetical protein A2075_19710 [Geobacteraceae bacterium GWC2_58_44]|nr:MAG: hypothetical protein A2075_19710 [Geobacteraceae bacterium GWC2_58_44]HBG06935.1 chromosome condensation regulator RCC1 [Geobacter sp.]